MKHFSKPELDRYIHKDMNILSRFVLSVHLNKCDACYKLLEELRHDDEILVNIREGIELFNSVPPDEQSSNNQSN